MIETLTVGYGARFMPAWGEKPPAYQLLAIHVAVLDKPTYFTEIAALPIQADSQDQVVADVMSTIRDAHSERGALGSEFDMENDELRRLPAGAAKHQWPMQMTAVGWYIGVEVENGSVLLCPRVLGLVASAKGTHLNHVEVGRVRALPDENWVARIAPMFKNMAEEIPLFSPIGGAYNPKTCVFEFVTQEVLERSFTPKKASAP